MATSSLIGALRVGIIADTKRAIGNLKKFKKEMQGFKGTAAGMKRAAGISVAAITAIGAAAVKVSREVMELADSLDVVIKDAARLGLSADELMGLQHAAKLAGVEANTLNMAMQRMIRRTSEAAQGTGEAVNAIKELGLDAATLTQMSGLQQLKEYEKAFQGIGNQADKIRLAMKLWDSEGVKMLNLFRSGIQPGLDSAEQLGIAIGDSADAVERFQEAVTKLKAAFDALKINQLLPLIEKVEPMLTLATQQQVERKSMFANLFDFGGGFLSLFQAKNVFDSMAREAPGIEGLYEGRHSYGKSPELIRQEQLDYIKRLDKERATKDQHKFIDWAIRGITGAHANFIQYPDTNPFAAANKREYQKTAEASFRPINRLINASTKEGYVALRANMRKTPERKTLVRIGEQQVRKLDELITVQNQQLEALGEITVEDVGP